MNDTSEVNIKLLADNSDAIISIKKSGGQVSEKCISVEDLSLALSKQHKMSTGILPVNTRFFKGDKNNYIVVIETPPKVRRFALHVNQKAREASNDGHDYVPETILVPFPNCLFTFVVRNRQLNNTYVFALNKRVGLETDELFCFPFGNVYDDGHVCWGASGDLPKITTPNVLTGVIANFLDSSFNGDLAERNQFVHPDPKISDFFALVRHLQGQSHFPLNILKRARVKTIQALVQSIGL